MHCLETNEFPYYPTDDVWRREEFSKFIQYQGKDNHDFSYCNHGSEWQPDGGVHL